MSRPKFLTLHIGGEKTGSKSIQRWLVWHAGVLARRHRILYPTRGVLCLRGAHYPVLSPFLAAEDLDFVESKRRLTQGQLEAALAALPVNGIDEIILSAEHLSSRLRPPHILALREVIAAALPGCRVRVLYHVRAQSSQYCAALSTYRKTLGTDRKTALEITTADRFFDHHRVASDWAEAFGDDALVIGNFHAGDAIDIFRQGLGRPDLVLGGPAPPARNTSLSCEEAAVLAAVNAAFGKADFAEESLIRTRRRVQEMLVLHLRVVLPVRTPITAMLEPAEWQHFQQAFAASNDRLTARFGLAFNLNDHMLAGAPPPGARRADPADDPAVRAEIARWLAAVGDQTRTSVTEAKRAAGRMQRRLGGLLLGHALRGKLDLRR